jgi:hypothetical protein
MSNSKETKRHSVSASRCCAECFQYSNHGQISGQHFRADGRAGSGQPGRRFLIEAASLKHQPTRQYWVAPATAGQPLLENSGSLGHPPRRRPAAGAEATAGPGRGLGGQLKFEVQGLNSMMLRVRLVDAIVVVDTIAVDAVNRCF